MTSTDANTTDQTQTHEVIAISQNDRIIDAARIMHENHIGCLVVAQDRTDETMVGIITERDILGWIGNASPTTYFQPVREIMTTDVVSCQPGASVTGALDLMNRFHMRHLPIVENGKAVGILSIRDLLERFFESNTARI